MLMASTAANDCLLSATWSAYNEGKDARKTDNHVKVNDLHSQDRFTQIWLLVIKDHDSQILVGTERDTDEH